MVSGIFRGTDENLSFIEVQKPPERLGNDSFLAVRRNSRLCDRRDLHEHRTDEVYALEELQVDVHVERKLSLLFQLFLFRGYLLLAVPGELDTLGEEFLLTLLAANLLE